MTLSAFLGWQFGPLLDALGRLVGGVAVCAGVMALVYALLSPRAGR